MRLAAVRESFIPPVRPQLLGIAESGEWGKHVHCVHNSECDRLKLVLPPLPHSERNTYNT